MSNQTFAEVLEFLETLSPKALSHFLAFVAAACEKHWHEDDVTELVRVSESLKLSIRLRDNVEYQKAVKEADARDAAWRAAGCPPRKGRPVAEIFADLRAEREAKKGGLTCEDEGE
jgi:hypothetical protein